MLRYWLRSGASLAYENLDDAIAVFDPQTGETHYLSELPALLLSSVNEEPALPKTLVSRLAGDIELNTRDLSQVLAALVYLEEAELVESRLNGTKPVA